MLHHRYIRYSNAKCDPLSSAVLFPGLAPPTLFSIHYVKTRVEEKKKKKNHCVRECVGRLVSHSLFFFSLSRTLRVFMCQRAFASSVGPAKVCVTTAIPTWGAMGRGCAHPGTAKEKKKKVKSRRRRSGSRRRKRRGEGGRKKGLLLLIEL